jgi:RES domain
MDMDLSVDALNQQELKKLLIAIEVSSQRTGLIFAICDDINVRSRITEQYESELQKMGIETQRVWLDTNQPSLYNILLPVEQHSKDLAVTVLGANELRSIPINSDRSQQEEFYYALQWSREALLQFKYPIVLWLTNSMATALTQQAPDFWSWRAGVFEFQATEEDYEAPEASALITEYKQIAKQLEEQNPRSPLLISFYEKIGADYQDKGQLKLSSKYYQLALNLSKENKDYPKELSYQKKVDRVLEDIAQINEFKDCDETVFSNLPLFNSSGPWYRFTNKNHISLFFDRSHGRFSSIHHPILYVASDAHVAFTETFSNIAFTGTFSGHSMVVSKEEITRKKLVEIHSNRTLVFADFTGHGLEFIGQSVISLYGTNFEISRELAKAIGHNLKHIDGIKYRSRHDLNRFNYAIFDRAARYLSQNNLGDLADNHPELLTNILNTYGYGIEPRLHNQPTIS